MGQRTGFRSFEGNFALQQLQGRISRLKILAVPFHCLVTPTTSNKPNSIAIFALPCDALSANLALPQSIIVRQRVLSLGPPHV